MKNYQFTLETQPGRLPIACKPCKLSIELEAEKLSLYDLAEYLMTTLGFQMDHAFEDGGYEP